MEEEIKKEQETSKNLDEWMKIWQDKSFPQGKTYEYSEWRRFWDFWFLEYPELPLKVAHTIWNIKKKEI